MREFYLSEYFFAQKVANCDQQNENIEKKIRSIKTSRISPTVRHRKYTTKHCPYSFFYEKKYVNSCQQMGGRIMICHL